MNTAAYTPTGSQQQQLLHLNARYQRHSMQIMVQGIWQQIQYKVCGWSTNIEVFLDIS